MKWQSKRQVVIKRRGEREHVTNWHSRTQLVLTVMSGVVVKVEKWMVLNVGDAWLGAEVSKGKTS